MLPAIKSINSLGRSFLHYCRELGSKTRNIEVKKKPEDEVVFKLSQLSYRFKLSVSTDNLKWRETGVRRVRRVKQTVKAEFDCNQGSRCDNFSER